MKSQAQAKTRLREMVENGALPASRCGRELLKLLESLIAGGVLEWKRKGAGRQLVVADMKAFTAFFKGRFPDVEMPANTGSRTLGVGNFRDSKAVKNNEGEIISIRAWRDDALLRDGQPVGAATATTAHGIFSFLLLRNCPYRLCGKFALAENPAVFASAERLNLDLNAVIYGGGRISSRALDWLACAANSNFNLVHLPDYDPVGLSEFERLHSRLGSRVVLHLPPDLQMRFARFSNMDLLKKNNSQTMLARLRKSKLPEVLRVVELIDAHNAGLEQEALLI